MADSPNALLRPPIGQNWGQDWERHIEQWWLADIGEPTYGQQMVRTQWDGVDWANVFSSTDPTLGQALRVRSQNGIYGQDVENAGMTIFGAPKLDAFTTGSVPFIGVGKVLSEDNANLFYDNAADTLKAKNLVVPTKAAVGAATLGAETLTVTGTAAVSSKLAVGAATVGAETVNVTGTQAISSKLAVGASTVDATWITKITGASSLWTTGAIQSDGDVTIGATKWVATASTGAVVQTGNLTINTTDFVVDVTNHRVSVGSASTTGYPMFNVAGMIRATNNTTPSAGTGMELTYIPASSLGAVISIDRATTTFKAMTIQGLNIALSPSGTDKFYVDGTGIRYFAGGAGVAKQNITGVRTGTLAQLQTVMANLLAGLAAYSFITDSTT